MARGTPQEEHSLLAAIEAEHARMRERLFSGERGELSDPELAARYLALARGLASLPREHLLGLRLMADLLGRMPEVTGQPAREAAGARAIEELLLFRRLADSSGHGFFVADARGEITYANATLCGMYGLESPAVAVGRSLGEFLPESERAGFVSTLLAPVLRDGRWVGELTVRSSQGRETPTIQNLFVVPGEQGRMPHIAALILDISDRKRMEIELRRSEETYRQLAERTWSGLLVMDDRGRALYVNPRLEEISGYPAEEFLRMDPWSVVHAEDRERIREIARRRREGLPAPREYEMRVFHRGGETLTVAVSGARMTWQGTPASFAFMQDITWRKQAEEALRESEEKYRDLVENIQDVIFIIDPQGRLEYISPVVRQLTGYDPSDIRGEHFSRFVHADDLPALADDVRRLIAGETPSPSEYRVVRKDGAERWVHSASRPILRGDRVIGLRGVMVDIHERRMFEEALRESEAKYTALVEQAQVGVLIIQDGIVRYANRYCAAMVGSTPEEVIGRPFTEFVAAEERDLQAGIHGRRLQGEAAPETYRARGLRRDGSRFLVENRTTLIQYGGRPAALVIVRDLREGDTPGTERV